MGCGNIDSAGDAQGDPRPIFTSVMPTLVPLRPTRRSQFSVSIMPPAISDPVIAAMIGFLQARMVS